MRPHPQHFHGLFILNHLVYQAMLDVDSPRSPAAASFFASFCACSVYTSL
jgi:hypothetical protein